MEVCPLGRQVWCFQSLETSTYERCCDLLNDGLKQNEIAMELGVNKSTVSRHVKRGKERGDIQVK
jgi:DNA-binding transcriptional regulator LsrR (DeoR family)